MLNRRSFVSGLLVALAAPAIVRTPGLLMRVKPVRLLVVDRTGNGNHLFVREPFGINDLVMSPEEDHRRILEFERAETPIYAEMRAKRAANHVTAAYDAEMEAALSDRERQWLAAVRSGHVKQIVMQSAYDADRYLRSVAKISKLA